MLSFMREQELPSSTPDGRPATGPNRSGLTDREKSQEGFENSSVQKPTDAAGRSPANSPKEAQEQEYFTVATKERQVRKSTILLAVLFSMGLLCLWFMIKKSTPQTAAARLAAINTEEARIEKAITELTGIRSEMFSGIERIVEKFYEFSDVLQVKVDELVKNPFKLEMFLLNAKESSDAEQGDSHIDADLIMQQQIRQEAKKLQLLSIMQSDQGNCCMINDKILYEGDSIKGFEVSQISNGFVKLEWDPKGDKGFLGTPSKVVEIILKLSQ